MELRVRHWRAGFVIFLAVIAASATVTTVAIAGSFSPPTGSDPTAFVRQLVAEIAANEYAIAWQSLHPAQQKLLPRAQYVRCESLSPIPGELTSIQVIHSQHPRITIAGARGEPVSSTAITLRLTIAEPALHDSVTITHTVHAVPQDDGWAWILPAERLSLDRAATCGTATYSPHFP
jgi:hypothetical protein